LKRCSHGQTTVAFTAAISITALILADSSHGVQLQNLKRPEIEDLGAAIDAVASGDLEHLQSLYPQPMSIVGDIVRGAFIASPGHRLQSADFSGIESRVLAWLAGESAKLNQWKTFDRTQDPKDEPYFIFGLKFGIPEQRARGPGKTGDLAFGFMGGIKAYRNFAGEDDPTTDAEIKAYQRAWRDAHPATVRFWGDINRAAIMAVQERGNPIRCNDYISFICDESFLRMRLPSGRELAYPFPKITTGDYGELAVVFMDIDDKGKWAECRHGKGAYGGTWTENAVSATARDIFVAAMPRLESAGYPIVLHTHDEIVAEVPDGFGSAEEFLNIMIALPDWAKGLPIAAKVREGPRFCKTAKPEPKAYVDPPVQESAEEQFCAAIERAGLVPPDTIIADHELHRFSSDGRPGKLAGWYVFHGNGDIATGTFGCWRTGIKESWQGNIGRPMTDEERDLIKSRIADAKQKHELEQKKAQAEASKRASRIWDSAAEAPADHPYLQKKGVQPHGLRIHSDGRLLVPLRDSAGAMHSVQFIAADGSKRFLTGGKVNGCHFILGEPNGVLALAEGFATGATIVEDVGHAVAVCFNAGNLPPAAEGLRAKFADLRFVVCADDDATVPGNPGKRHAAKAATILDASLAIPHFGADRPEGASDFNDLRRHAGPDEVRACFRATESPEENSGTPSRPETKPRIELTDFYAYMPMHNYIYAPTGEVWPASSVNSRIPPVLLFNASGVPVLNLERRTGDHRRQHMDRSTSTRRTDDMGARIADGDSQPPYQGGWLARARRRLLL
jgi:phage/plasmid primase-like uncharacterized protein